MLTVEEVAHRVRKGESPGQIAKRYMVSVQYVNGLRRAAFDEGLIDRMHYSHGRKHLDMLIGERAIQLGSINIILSKLDDETVEYLVQRRGKRGILALTIAEIINEAARNSGHGKDVRHKGPRRDAR